MSHCLGNTKAPEERSQYNGVIAFMAKKFPSESTEPALKFSHPLQEKEGVNAQFWEPGKRQEGGRERGRGVIGAQSRGFRESLAFRFHRLCQPDRRRHWLQAEVAQIQTSGLVAKQNFFGEKHVKASTLCKMTLLENQPSCEFGINSN